MTAEKELLINKISGHPQRSPKMADCGPLSAFRYVGENLLVY